jgi:hypothetical protein
MKIRNGFVSNSSSSSFCIYGTIIEDSEENREMLLKFLEEKCNVSKEDIENLREDEYMWKIGYEVTEQLKDLSSDYYDDSLYLGRSWRSVKDEETGKQFKESIEKKLKEILGDKIKCGTYEECWQNC